MQAQIQPVTTLKPVPGGRRAPVAKLTHLARLEAESIHIFREVAAEFAKPLLMLTVRGVGLRSSSGSRAGVRRHAPKRLVSRTRLASSRQAPVTVSDQSA